MEDKMTVSDGNYKLEVFRDEFAENPREWDNLGKMVCWHSRYNLGDKHEFVDPQAFQESEDFKNAFVILPVYLYDHSGITMSNTDFGDRWDSGQVGYIYVTKEQAQNEYHCELDEALAQRIKELLVLETETYDNYLQGDCYGFKVTDEQGVELDSCGGFFGDDLSDVIRDMRDSSSDEYMGLFNKLSHHSSAYAAMM